MEVWGLQSEVMSLCGIHQRYIIVRGHTEGWPKWGESPAEREGWTGVREGDGNVCGCSKIKVSAERKPLCLWVVRFLIIRNLEREWTSENPTGVRSAHAKGSAKKLGCRTPDEREFKPAFSLAKILGINQKFSPCHHIQNHLSLGLGGVTCAPLKNKHFASSWPYSII